MSWNFWGPLENQRLWESLGICLGISRHLHGSLGGDLLGSPGITFFGDRCKPPQICRGLRKESPGISWDVSALHLGLVLFIFTLDLGSAEI